MTTSPSRKVRDILATGTAYLRDKGIDDAEPACRLLLGRLLKCRPLDVLLKSDLELNEAQLEAMRRGIKRVAAGEPPQYIVGETEFMGHRIKTDRRALIPRPETEVLVEQMLACDSIWKNERPAILDMGTGSGCIVISIALARPQAVCIAMDASSEALALAAENAKAHNLESRITLAPVDAEDLLEPESLDAIVANLPYIRTADCDRLPVRVRDYEPRMALDGGPDGLALIRECVDGAAVLLKSSGYLFLEIGADQGNAVRALLTGAGFDAVRIIPDLAGHDRIVCGRMP